MTKVKLCGLMSAQDAAYANEARPDFAGTILSPGFRRSVTRETAEAIRRTLDPGIPLVGVFVNAQISEIMPFLEAGVIQAVQLHGGENADYIAQLRQKTALPVIKAFKITSSADLKQAEECTADHVLLDSGTGTGVTFDWSLLRNFPRPFFLAGGLTPENAADAVKQMQPFAVDTSSGIETDGQKDIVKMRAFVKAVRG